MRLDQFIREMQSLQAIAERTGVTVEIHDCKVTKTAETSAPRGKRGPRGPYGPRKRKMSPAARAKIAAAQRRIWAEKRKTAARNIVNRVRETAHAKGL